MSPEPVPSVRPRRRPTAAPKAEPPEAPKANGHDAADATASDEFARFRAAIEEQRAAQAALVARWGYLDPSIDEHIRQLGSMVVMRAEGLGYAGSGPGGVLLTLSRLRESRGELSGELAIERWHRPLYQARFNLSSGTHRAATARLLERHPFGGRTRELEAIDWREVLEQLSLQVLASERGGEVFEHVGANEPQASPPRVVDPFLPAGPTLLWAPQGVGKSTIAAAVVMTLESFVEVIPGWHPVAQRRCLVLDWEASPTEWNDRIRRIAAGIGDEPPSVLYRRPRRPLADQVETIAAVVDREQIGYLVIDSVEKAAGARSEGSTYEEKAERLFLAIDRIGIPALLIDHVTGEELRSGMSKVSPKSIGSVMKGAWARATYDLKRDPEASTDRAVQMLLTNVKVNDARKLPPFEFAIVYDGDEHTGPIRFERSRLDSPELMAALPLPERMWRLLIHAGHSLPTKELAKLLDTSDGTIRAALSHDSHRERPRFVRLPDNSIAIRQGEE